MKFKKVSHLIGEIDVPGDKSISHRAIMLGTLANGTTTVTNFLQGADCLSSIDCFRKLGIQIENKIDTVIIHGNGLHGLKKPTETLDVGNSGTTMRLMSGILSAADFDVVVTGDASIQKRPMGRIMTPLRLMGADITSLNNNNCAPLKINGTKVHPISYQSPVASAQVKSSILLAGLYADGKTSVTEPFVSRNHSELMLNYFGATVTSEGTTATITPPEALYGREINVPGDISSAAYFIGAGLITPNSEILIKNVGVNKTRDGILRVVKAMGGNVTLLNKRLQGLEETADLLVKTSSLHGTTIEGEVIPTLIDEIPLLAVLACFASGTTVIKDAAELKVKESNRIDVMVTNLKAMGADITATEDGMIINGGAELHGANIDSHLDHRIAMSFAVAGINASGETKIKGSECVDISYPTFYQDLNRLIQ
ncbi:MAG: 3-phosphoshikimate 1-carboxyvinyltransferase [bacterium]|nr:3-phosphoshikimate 1-carboxyvinyltransferase [bacterium]